MEPAPKPRLPLVIGLLLIAAGITLLVLFTSDPKGALPGMPNAWKGGPMLLGAGFLAIVGAFLVVLRRFSLAGFMVGGIVSGAMAAAANGYIQSIRETRSRHILVAVPENEQELFIKLVSQRVTAERLVGMLNHLYAAGELSAAPDFEAIKIRWGASSKRELALVLEYESSPYVHARRKYISGITNTYARAIIGLSAEDAALSQGRTPTPSSWDDANRIGAKRNIEILCGNVMWMEKRAVEPQHFVRLLDVLMKAETDPDMKRLIEENWRNAKATLTLKNSVSR